MAFHNVLSRHFYERDPLTVTKSLLGKLIVRKVKRGVMIGKIVETEAYIAPHDKASHAYGNRKTERTIVQFGERGCAYIFKVYGRNHCFCVVVGPKYISAVALIRAVEPIEGIELMMKNRPVKSTFDLTSGPSKFCQAFKITSEFNSADLCRNRELYIAKRGKNREKIIGSIRIGIDYAEEYRNVPWRFYIKDNIFVSKG